MNGNNNLFENSLIHFLASHMLSLTDSSLQQYFASEFLTGSIKLTKHLFNTKYYPTNGKAGRLLSNIYPQYKDLLLL